MNRLWEMKTRLRCSQRYFSGNESEREISAQLQTIQNSFRGLGNEKPEISQDFMQLIKLFLSRFSLIALCIYLFDEAKRFSSHFTVEFDPEWARRGSRLTYNSKSGSGSLNIALWSTPEKREEKHFIHGTRSDSSEREIQFLFIFHSLVRVFLMICSLLSFSGLHENQFHCYNSWRSCLTHGRRLR